MSHHFSAIRLGRALLALAALATSVTAAPPREVHGVAEAYAEPGVAIAWAVPRGTNEATTLVVVRIVADPARYASVVAQGSNPFSERKQPLLSPTPTAGNVDLRAPRAQFADFPRSEFRFYGSSASVQPDAPSLVVFYLGVPDTTPEFATEAAMEGYLADRIARLRATTGKGSP